MSTKLNTNQVVLDIIQEGVKKGILHLKTGEEKICNTQISIHNREVTNFSSCSYLGLEHHPALKDGAKAAIDSFGTQFSASRAYLSLGLYERLENDLSLMFQGNKTLVTATTTLGHIAAIPVLVEDGDAVLIDHQVHHSVQTAAGLLRNKNVHIEMIRHNNMTVLEEKIMALKQRYAKIWYLADGVYSMFGDLCPVGDIVQLLNKYEQLRLYIDDAHGMSYFGKHGAGYVFSQGPLHPHMILGTSLNKAFAAGGGALIFPDEQSWKKVRTCGSTLITSGPLQPANLGAGIASAQLHLSNEIYDLQDNLADKIRFTKMLLLNTGLPLISESDAAIFFVGVAVPKIGYRVVQKMLERGFYVNLGIFPAVPIKNTGIRFTITTLHTYKQISDMVAALKEEFEAALRTENFSIEQVFRSFKKELPENIKIKETVSRIINHSANYKAEVYNSIEDIEIVIWDSMFKGRGVFDWNGLASLEQVFSANDMPEDNWVFNYIIVKNNAQEIVAAAFVTTSLWKDDMLSPADVSAQIELLRKTNPYYLVSKITSAGSLITEGEHIFINREHKGWHEGLTILLDKVSEIQQSQKSSGVVLRDFTASSSDVFTAITDNGYFKASMPDAHTAVLSGWANPAQFFETLSRKGKMHFRTDIRKYYEQFDFVTKSMATAADIRRWYAMYLSVREKNLSINTFALPTKFFEMAASTNQWEINVLVHKDSGIEMAVVICYRSGRTYIPVVIGMEYEYLQSHKIYKQTLYRLLERAAVTNCTSVQMGFGASMEKKKLNCKPAAVYSFVQMHDSFNSEFIRNYKAVSS